MEWWYKNITFGLFFEDVLTLFVQMVEITKIGRLDGKNYQSWKYDIKFVLMEHGLWRFVEGTETAPGVSVAVTVKMHLIFLRTKLTL